MFTTNDMGTWSIYHVIYLQLVVVLFHFIRLWESTMLCVDPVSW